MKRLFISIVTFFKKEHLAKYLVQFFLFAGALAGCFCLISQDAVSNVVSTIIGFLFSTAVLYMFKVIASRFEDILKVSDDTEYMLQLYKGDPSYKKTLSLNGTEVIFAYADTLVNDGSLRFEVEYDPEKMFEPDDFIRNYYFDIFAAHSNSVKINSQTIRLDDVRIENGTCTFFLSRSTVFNHLVTNRAVDFALFENLTLRHVYEYGPTISPYAKSKMSNHIGINALVFLSDGRLLVPRRNGASTISKNMITSSIAVKLDFPKSGEKTVTADHLLYQNIIDNLDSRVHLTREQLDLDALDVVFLGFGQNLYEAGKPQFYFAVHLKNIDTAAYLSLSASAASSQTIDVDKCIYVADYSTMHFHKDKVLFDAVDAKGKHKRMKTHCELSYYCNLWHYERYLAKRGKK